MEITERTQVNTTEAEVAVLITSTDLLAANPVRRLLVVQNKGEHPVYVSTDGDAADAADMLLAAGAGFSWDRRVPVGAIKAIAVGGTSNVFVSEGE